MRKIIIITGSVGFIGSALIDWLYKEYDIIGIDRKEDEFITDSRYTKIRGDINDPETYKKLRDDIKIYAVIHLAARTGVRQSQEEFESYVKDNILGTKSVLDNCIKYWKPEKILIASSSSVYGDAKIPTSEDRPKNPKSLYAMSKCATEDIASSYKNSGLLTSNICCMRIFTVFGPNQRDGLAIGNFIKNILKDKPVIIYGNGYQRRDFVFIDDLCLMINKLLKYKKELPFILNMGLGITYNLHDILKKLSSITGKSIEIEYKLQNPFDVRSTKSNTDLLESYIGKISPISIDKGLEEQVKYELI